MLAHNGYRDFTNNLLRPVGRDKIMELEKQVANIELSKRLKELGMEQNSLFYWIITLTNAYHISYTGGDKSLLPTERNDYYSAFTVAELGEKLPYRLRLKVADYWLRIFKGDDFWDIRYCADEEKLPLFLGREEYSCQDKLLSNTFAKMLCFLLENKLIGKG